MTIVIIFFAIVLLVKFPELRILLKHPFLSVYYGCRDLIQYIRHKEWNMMNTGDIVCYCSPNFGGGKTLSTVAYIRALYIRYHDKPVFDKERGKFVTQKIIIYSNVDFTDIPYIKLESMAQISSLAKNGHAYDQDNDVLTQIIILIDEAMSELNSRSFKDNFNSVLLKDLVTIRHNRMSIFLTAQDFSKIDTLLRSTCTKVIYAFKTWRLVVHRYYDPKQLDIAGSYLMIEPLHTGGFFATDKHYHAYDTYAIVENLQKKFTSEDIMSEKEILERLQPLYAAPQVLNPSKGFIRSARKLSRRSK